MQSYHLLWIYGKPLFQRVCYLPKSGHLPPGLDFRHFPNGILCPLLNVSNLEFLGTCDLRKIQVARIIKPSLLSRINHKLREKKNSLCSALNKCSSINIVTKHSRNCRTFPLPDGKMSGLSRCRGILCIRARTRSCPPCQTHLCCNLSERHLLLSESKCKTRLRKIGHRLALPRIGTEYTRDFHGLPGIAKDCHFLLQFHNLQPHSDNILVDLISPSPNNIYNFAALR